MVSRFGFHGTSASMERISLAVGELRLGFRRTTGTASQSLLLSQPVRDNFGTIEIMCSPSYTGGLSQLGERSGSRYGAAGKPRIPHFASRTRWKRALFTAICLELPTNHDYGEHRRNKLRKDPYSYQHSKEFTE